MSATLAPNTIRLETTNYVDWTTFRDTFVDVLRALEATTRADGIGRVGLRYIDEVRLPDPPEALAGWSGWIHDRLVSPFSIDAGAPVSAGTVALQYGEAPGYVTLFRAAPFPSGRTVQQAGALRLPFDGGDGPYFLLDTDSSWVDPQRQVPEFNTDRIVEILEILHTTCHTLYEGSITDRLRDEVLRVPRPETLAS